MSAAPRRQHRSCRDGAECARRRQSRSGARGASWRKQAGADGITAHLREDRRHISDERYRAPFPRAGNPAQSGNGRDRRNAGHRAQGASRMPPASCRKSAKSAPPKAASTWSAISPASSRLSARWRGAASGSPCSSSPTASSLTPRAHWARRWWNCIPAPMPMRRRRGARSCSKHIHNAAEFGADLGLEIHAGHGLTYDNVDAHRGHPPYPRTQYRPFPDRRGDLYRA